MTLVVGRITQGGLRLDCDSKITDPNIAPNQNHIFSGVLKTIIVNPNICFSYAGDVEYAQEAIENIYKLTNPTVESLKKELLNIHKTSDGETDFLIGSLEQQPLLYKISKAKIEVSNSFQWIGDIEGFSLFQKEFLPKIKSTDPKHISSVHSEAFKKVVESNIESIGGFHLTAHRTKVGLEYMMKMEIQPGRPTSVTVTSGEMKKLPLGNAEIGAYSYSYLKSSNPYKPAIGIHFPMTDLGTLYYPKISRKIIFFRNMNPFEFKKSVKEKYKIDLTGMVKNGDMMTMV